MTEADVTVLMGFFGGGVLLGMVGNWMDQLLEYIRKR